MLEQELAQATVRRMFIACWITKVKNTHSEYVIRRKVNKYPHRCYNFLWVGGTAFCTRMLTDSTFVSACGKFQRYHTVYLCAVTQLERLRHSPCARRKNSVA